MSDSGVEGVLVVTNINGNTYTVVHIELMTNAYSVLFRSLIMTAAYRKVTVLKITFYKAE